MATQIRERAEVAKFRSTVPARRHIKCLERRKCDLGYLESHRRLQHGHEPKGIVLECNLEEREQQTHSALRIIVELLLMEQTDDGLAICFPLSDWLV